MEQEDKDIIRHNLVLPEDILSDILEGEKPDDINKLREALEQDGN